MFYGEHLKFVSKNEESRRREWRRSRLDRAPGNPAKYFIWQHEHVFTVNWAKISLLCLSKCMQKILLFGNHQLTDSFWIFFDVSDPKILSVCSEPDETRSAFSLTWKCALPKQYCEMLNQKTGCVLGRWRK